MAVIEMIDTKGKNMKRKMYLMMLIAALILSGCGPIDEENMDAGSEISEDSNQSDDTASEISSVEVKPLSEYTSDSYPFNADDIEFSFEEIEGEAEGETYFRLNYKNNTPYTITGISYKFAYKDDIDKSERYLRGTTVTNWKIVAPGEYATGSLIRDYEQMPVASLDDFDVENPVWMQISLSDDDVLEYHYTYNFDNEKFDEYFAGENSYELIRTEERELFPDTPVYKADTLGSGEDLMMARFCGIKDVSDYHDYVSKLKDKGFTDIISEDYYKYDATNDAGKSVSVYFDYYNDSIIVMFDTAAEDNPGSN